MKCGDIQNLIPMYLDEALEAEEIEKVSSHVKGCSLCQKELANYKASWDMLGEWTDIQPSANYVSRFWTKVSLQKKWYEKLWEIIQENIQYKRLVPVLVTACVMMVVSSVFMYNYSQKGIDNRRLAKVDVMDIEMVENIELAENLDVIENLEFFEDFEIIESLDV